MKENGVDFEDMGEIKSGNHRAYPLKGIAWIYLGLSIVGCIVLLCFSVAAKALGGQISSTYLIGGIVCLLQGLVIFYFIFAFVSMIENTHATNKLLNKILNNQKRIIGENKVKQETTREFDTDACSDEDESEKE